MPLTNTQKILAWGSAGLMATASALGVMFYSPTILGQNHTPSTSVSAKATNNSRIPNKYARWTSKEANQATQFTFTNKSNAQIVGLSKGLHYITENAYPNRQWLGSYFHVPMNASQPKIAVYYPNSVKYKGKYLDTVAIFYRFGTYYPLIKRGNWATDKYMDISKNLSDGIIYCGHRFGYVTFTFYKPGTKQIVNVPNAAVEFDSLNGVQDDRGPIPGVNHYYHRSAHDRVTGEWTNYRNNGGNETGYYVGKYDNNIAGYPSPSNGNMLVTGGVHDKGFPDANFRHPPKAFYKNSIIYLMDNEPRQTFQFGSGEGSAWWKLSTQIYKPKKTKKDPYSCTVTNNQISTNLHVGNKATKTQLLGPNKEYGKSMSNSTYHKIVNGKYRVTKSGLKYWEKTVASCIIRQPKPQHHHYSSPTPTTRKPIKYLTGIKRASDKIDNYSGGGILKKPDEDYNYNIKGLMPVRTASNTKSWYYWSDKHGNPHKTFLGYYDGHTNDKYVVEDHVPSYLKITSTPTMNVGGQTVQADHGTSHDVTFTFNSTDMDNYSGQVYHATIPVEDADSETDSTNHLPKPNKAGWLTIWNGGKHINNANKGHATDASAYGTIYGKTIKHDYTNTVPVELKEIKANIWHYDYNHDHNMVNDGYDNFFPDYEQPMGIMNDIFDPTNISFKNYRFSRFFNSTQQPQTSQSGTKTFDSAKHAGLLQRDTHYWYAGTYHDINTANAQTTKNIDGNSQYLRYRFIYPSLSGSTNDASDMNPFDVNTFKDKIDSINDAKNQDHIADGSNHVAMNANPDDGNYYKGGFNENRYMPYFIPRVSLNQNINPQTGKPESGASNNDGFRMVIDTDKAQHGLPFRINMKSQNILYGRHYYDDFKNVNVEMNVSDSNTHKPLYENIRPLVGESSKALIHRGIYHKHSYTYSESPDGSKNYNNHTGRWHGYAEASALGDHYYNGNYDLDTRGNVYSPGQKIPIHVSFNLVYGKYQGNNPHNYHQWRNSDSAPEVDMQDFNTHAYISNNPTLNHNDFGKNHVTGDADQDHNGDLPKAQSDRATFIEPERTIEYGSNPKGDNVRELKEQLSATQPRNAVGKTGYGISANDFGLDYRGHLEASDYAHKGTNMQFAFPEAFNTKDSNISYKHDTRDHSLLADNLLHVEPNYDYDYANENFGLPSYLDTHNNNSDDVNTDSEFESTFPEHLSTGDFSTTYGFYPRETINEDSNGKNNNTNNGNVALSSDADSYPYNGQGSDGSSYNDPSISNLGNSDKAYGLKTTNHDVDNNSNNEYAHTISTNGQNERMFTPLFLQSGNYPDVFHRAFENTNSTNDRDHRLGGNFFDIDENRPIKLVGHQYISKNDRPRDQKYDELSLQPILTNPENGLMQTPISNPAFPTQSSSLKDGWLTDNLWSGMYGSHTALLR